MATNVSQKKSLTTSRKATVFRNRVSHKEFNDKPEGDRVSHKEFNDKPEGDRGYRSKRHLPANRQR